MFYCWFNTSNTYSNDFKAYFAVFGIFKYFFFIWYLPVSAGWPVEYLDRLQAYACCCSQAEQRQLHGYGIRWFPIKGTVTLKIIVDTEYNLIWCVQTYFFGNRLFVKNPSKSRPPKKFGVNANFGGSCCNCLSEVTANLWRNYA